MREQAPGVYLLDENGATRLVHGYLDDGYELDDVRELFELGTAQPGGVLLLTARELRMLGVTAHAQSFDHAPELITMCLEMAAVDVAPGVASLRFVSVG